MTTKDERGGYSVAADAVTRTVRVEAWGFWSPAIAGGFADAVLAKCQGLMGATVAIDARNLMPQREEAQAAFARLFEALRMHGLRLAISTTSSLTKLQLQRLVKERGLESTVALT